VEWAVPAPLNRYLACSWTGGFKSEGEPSLEPVLPDGCTDIIWDGERLFVAGPDTRPNQTLAGGPFTIGVRFLPGVGSCFLGVPASDLRDQRVALDRLWVDAEVIADQLARCSTLRQAAAVLEGFILRRVGTVHEPDPIVQAAIGLWQQGCAVADVAALARRAGMTERQLHRRFVRAVGYGPKLLHRVLRFQSFLAASSSTGVGLAELAFRAGYADQAHLSRDARILAGRTPAELRAPRLGVRNVHDPRRRII
jgi:AraC-like DNA-binding protein